MVIGGAGFIGSHISNHHLIAGDDVTILDNFSRVGSQNNLQWLKSKHGRIKVIAADIAGDNNLLNRAVKRKDVVYHFAGQVAVNTSILDPRRDFMVNAFGTFNVLEALRLNNPDALLLFSSTMRIYGQMQDVKTKRLKNRYIFTEYPNGIPESRFLDFHTPYSCSKGAADQYVHDYARIYNLRTIIFRQSCIYGPRQFSIENHGWVSWFIASALLERPIMIFGDGRQVRDILFIDDLVSAYRQAIQRADVATGQVYNIGGGMKNSLSLREMLFLLRETLKMKVDVIYEDWRKGDTKVFVSDVSKATHDLKWTPAVNVEEGVRKTIFWMKENISLFKKI
jgi:CDP-paratose 2-epimerase